jgi:hypothetical protein
MYKPHEFAKKLGVTVKTLQRWGGFSVDSGGQPLHPSKKCAVPGSGRSKNIDDFFCRRHRAFF